MNVDISTPRVVYKRYAFDVNYEIPRSTKHYREKIRKKICLDQTEPDPTLINQQHQQKNDNFINRVTQEDFQNLTLVDQNQNNTDEFTDDLLEAIEISSNFDEKPNKIEIASALLAAYFSGKMTQHALTIVLKLMNILIEEPLPKNFDELSKLILKDNNDKITYSKKWYCYACKIYINIDDKDRTERTCRNCKER